MQMMWDVPDKSKMLENFNVKSLEEQTTQL